MKVRTRYAPSPTGFLHVGGARTALFNYLFAKHNKGDFIVRIEDTDVERNVEGGIESQLENLRWLGLEIDETVDKPGKFGPYKQTERLDIYTKHINMLLEKGIAYKCFCTTEELEADREKQQAGGIHSPKYSGKCRDLTTAEIDKLQKEKEFTIRIKVPDEEFKWKDMVRGDVSVFGRDVGDWVAIKSNGIPTYNFAVVVDDHLMEISHVMRGEEHISNTPKQIHLYNSFGWDVPQFGHMTIITNQEGKKLSKRDTSVKQFLADYKTEGYCEEGIFNFLALLGWSPGGEDEIFNSETLIEMFTQERLSKSPSTFDINKMKWMSQQYFAMMTNQDAYKYCEKFLVEKFDAVNKKGKDWAIELIDLYKNGLSCGQDIVEYAEQFFSEFKIDSDSQKFLKENDCKAVIEKFSEEFSKLNTLDADSFKALIKQVGKDVGAKGKLLFMPIRIITTGLMHGADLFSAIKLIGLEDVKKRLK